MRGRARRTDAEHLLSGLADHITDRRVLDALADVPRELFVPERRRSQAYRDEAMPIDCGQTISQPFVVARMTALLEIGPEDRVLDVGTGSGWHAAVLSRLAARVWTIERHAPLAKVAERALAEAGVQNVTVIVGDGTLGHPPDAPYDAINVAAAASDLSPALLAQLAPGGRLVAPVGGTDQRLVRVRRTPEGLVREDLDPVRFVPLVPGLPDP